MPSNKKPGVKTTSKDFSIFKAECQRLVPILGLTGWTIYWQHVPVKGCFADAQCDALEKIATIRFSKDWFSHEGFHALDKQNVQAVAKHEMAHVLMSDLLSLATARYVQKDEVDEAEHRIVRVLEKLL